jgi:hypothetical protein
MWRVSRSNSIMRWQGYRVSASRLAESNFRYSQDRKGRVIDTQYRLMSQEEANYAKHDREDGAARKQASAPRSGDTRSPSADNAWSPQPWGAQQQWGWQSGFGQQWRDDRQEWRPSW